MILYHGSTVVADHPKIIKSEVGRDFGFAFYTTDIREQAIRWAKRKAMLKERRFGQSIIPIVSCYLWEEKRAKNELSLKEFTGTDIDWLEMVVECRSRMEHSHGYDVVLGNIANDNVGETISYVIQGIMRKEDAIKRLEFEKINKQIAFCTARSLNYLTFDSYFECR
ncbi:MAG: DUF3990 domain-containing protein [Eubacterium sp.]|nr:DUF3990 domain-containing protein [Eubacterium sp.]